MRPRIYFAGSIRGGRDGAAQYQAIIKTLSRYGDVLTEHVGNLEGSPDITEQGSDSVIFRRDMAWLRSADTVIAEVTIPSHGVGYEIGRAEAMDKPILCLYRPEPDRRLSAMLAGNPALKCRPYHDPEELETILKAFLDALT